MAAVRLLKDGGSISWFSGAYEPAEPEDAEFVRLVQPNGDAEIILNEGQFDQEGNEELEFHLPGQHDQQSHAGGEPGDAQDSIASDEGDPQAALSEHRWREDDIDISNVNNTKLSHAEVAKLEDAFYNATPETLDEMLGWGHIEQLQELQRQFEKDHPGLIGVRVDASFSGPMATVDTLHKVIDKEQVYGVDSQAAASWIANNGHAMPLPRTPPAFPLGRFKRCYNNTLEFVASHRGYKYCEGLVVDAKHGIAVQHAWAVDKKGEVVDVTLGWQPKAYYHGITYPSVAKVREARRKSGDLLTITSGTLPWLRRGLKA